MTCERVNAEDIRDLEALFPKDLESRIQQVRAGAIDVYYVEFDGRPVGRIIANYMDQHLDGETIPGRRACFSHFILFKEHRNKGMGGELLAFALQDLRVRGYTEFTVGVEADNHIAKHLYEKAGFTERIGHGSVPCEYDLYLLRDQTVEP